MQQVLNSHQVYISEILSNPFIIKITIVLKQAYKGLNIYVHHSFQLGTEKLQLFK